jgi:hypothetical protein
MGPPAGRGDHPATTTPRQLPRDNYRDNERDYWNRNASMGRSPAARLAG